MSFAKYFEDNMEIIEERFALRQQKNDFTPIYRATQEVHISEITFLRETALLR